MEIDDKLLVPKNDYLIMDSIVDGPGLRTTLFVQGCPHNCPGCHNPGTHSFTQGQLVSIDSIYNLIKKDTGASGITFSGGEPFMQAEKLSLLAQKLKADGYDIAVYSGFTFEQLFSGNIKGAKALLSNVDILIDGKFDISQRSLEIPFRGSKNQRILDVPSSLEQQRAVWTTNSSWLIKECNTLDEFAPKDIRKFG